MYFSFRFRLFTTHTHTHTHTHTYLYAIIFMSGPVFPISLKFIFLIQNCLISLICPFISHIDMLSREIKKVGITSVTKVCYLKIVDLKRNFLKGNNPKGKRKLK